MPLGCKWMDKNNHFQGDSLKSISPYLSNRSLNLFTGKVLKSQPMILAIAGLPEVFPLSGVITILYL